MNHHLLLAVPAAHSPLRSLLNPVTDDREAA